ncbi:MAG: RNA polymerase sigma factor [Pseudomonadota bacterium]
MANDFNAKLVHLLPNLRRFALTLCRSRDVADDLVQQTCQKAIINKASFEPGTRMEAWLFRILRNTWIDMTRRQQTEGTPVDIDQASDMPRYDGETAAETRLMLESTFKEIEALPDDQREVLILICVEELSYKEAADVLDAPIGTIMSRLARARQKLSENLGINSAAKRSPTDKSGQG